MNDERVTHGKSASGGAKVTLTKELVRWLGNLQLILIGLRVAGIGDAAYMEWWEVLLPVLLLCGGFFAAVVLAFVITTIASIVRLAGQDDDT